MIFFDHTTGDQKVFFKIKNFRFYGEETDFGFKYVLKDRIVLFYKNGSIVILDKNENNISDKFNHEISLYLSQNSRIALNLIFLKNI